MNVLCTFSLRPVARLKVCFESLLEANASFNVRDFFRPENTNKSFLKLFATFEKICKYLRKKIEKYQSIDSHFYKFPFLQISGIVQRFCHISETII